MQYIQMAMLLLLFYLFGPTLADYDCLCTYQVETNIYAKPDLNSNVIGYMYEFDCKPTYTLAWIDPKFQPIGNEHILGFIEVASQNSVQVCQGSIPNLDKVPPEYLTPPPTTTTTTVTTSTQQTTTTTTLKPTTTTTTPPPTTTTTTPPPTTTTTTPPPTTTTTTPPPTTTTTTPPPTTTTTTPPPTTTTTTPPPTTTTTTPPPTTTTTTPSPTTITVSSTKQTTVPTTPRPTTISRTTTHAHTTVTVQVNTVQGPNNLCPSTVKYNTQLDNLFVHNQFCYEFVNQKNSFFHAEYDCPKRGGTMVYIRDHSDQDFLYRMMRDLNHYGPVWLGLHDVNKEEAWEWVSDYPLTYTNWMPSRFHDSAHDAEDCGVFVAARHNGQWDDVHCSGILFSSPAEYPWICQYNITLAG